MKHIGLVVPFVLIEFVFSRRPGSGPVQDITLRMQLKKKIDVCKGLSIFEDNVRPSKEKPSVLCRSAWTYGVYLFIRFFSQKRKVFAVYILQVRNENDLPVGTWDNMTEETWVDCPPGKQNTVFVRDNIRWTRASIWHPPADYSTTTNYTLHFTVYYSERQWWKLRSLVPYRYQDSHVARANMFKSEDYSVDYS